MGGHLEVRLESTFRREEEESSSGSKCPLYAALDVVRGDVSYAKVDGMRLLLMIR